MKRNKLFLLLILLLPFIGQHSAYSRCAIPSGEKETVTLFTDRSIYIAGEQLRFFATIAEDTKNNPLPSQVLYCELITPDGHKIAGYKYGISQLTVQNCFSIPGDILTGTYYFRAYTKLMRNYGPSAYAYSQVRIVNPARNELLVTDTHEANSLKQVLTVKDGMFHAVSVSADKNEYLPHDSVYLSFQVNTGPASRIKTLCLSVIPESTATSAFVPMTEAKFNERTEYYPETRSLSLTGKLTDTKGNTPARGKKVNLSIIGEGRDFMAARTDSGGRFFFSLPAYGGSRDLFLCAEKTEKNDLRIWVDNDFCALPVSLPSPAFVLSEKERLIVRDMALNVQIDSHFHPDTVPEPKAARSEDVAFYGKPTSVLYLDQYIQLPTLEEYFNELPGLVKVRKRNGERYFKITGYGDLSYYDPLILVDWVAVDEPEKILAVSPHNILRIDLINEAYVKGGQTYGGIISIISKKGDFAGIDLPSTGIFVNYRFLSPEFCRNKADFNLPGHPDTRNTLLWKPGFNFRENDKPRAFFTAPDTPGKYLIVLEGISEEGERFSTTQDFEVKN
ncbi:MAG: hypothetical protein WCR72_05800 [Bacteroidota bacterium]